MNDVNVKNNFLFYRLHSKDRKNWKITLSFGFYNQKTAKIGTIYIVWFLCIVNPLSIVYHSKPSQQLVLELYLSSILLALYKMKVQDISFNKISHKMLFKKTIHENSAFPKTPILSEITM